MNNKYVILLVALLASISSLLFWKKSKTHEDDALIVGTNPNFPPFEFTRNGEIVGFEIDLMNEVAKKIGKKIMYKDLAFDALLLEINFGRIQAIAAAMTPTPERTKQVLFTKPYLEHDPLVVISLATHPITTLDDLKGKEVVVNDGYTAESYMAQNKNVVLKRLPTPAEAFLALKAGRAHAYVSARSAVQPFFDQYGTMLFNIFVIPDASDSYALAISPRHPELQADIQKALDSLEADGTLKELKKKWHLLW